VVESAAALVAKLDWPKLAVVVLLLALYVVLGTFMDSFTVMVITVPVVTPLILGMGYNLAWWGVLMLVVVEAGNISPPFGLNMFVLKTLMPEVPMGTVFKGVMPFFVAALAGLALCTLYPPLITWLPASMPK
jgi:TRAP-type C4-dicarboxylate transport system permease large subunit